MGLLDRSRSGEDVLSSVLILPLEKCVQLQLEVLNGGLKAGTTINIFRLNTSFNSQVPNLLC